jgi:transcriptional regulator with XRE-family HTH domain
MKRGANDIRVRFGTAVRKRRHELGISQEELAGRADLHRTYVADIERGTRNVALISIEKLARALALDIATLMGKYGVDAK